ncbi:PREDICTED: uncharacterized protein LOC109230004 [Nicotiana attenuata]|uniref:uncharacterized protein LOC109230004 n=1 Tax=Nicotiana attenuata TaxID=49451 RepID=UPI000904F8A7|nr:PREDICTED: uncharacterized protein LOC109230004 [Nicotiana attenuata]
MVLNDSYSQARRQIIMKSKIPTVNQAYAMILQDESQKLVASGSYSAESIDPTALFSSKIGQKQRRNFNEFTIEPHNHQGQQSLGPMQMFTPKQYGQILSLLNKASLSESSDSAHMAGNVSYEPNTDEKWIVDTGATNHMVGNEQLLLEKLLVGNARNVQLPTRESTKVSHVGSCRLDGGDTINNVLCVPAFKFNLLSVSQLTKALNCCAAFFPNFCIFQDLFSGRVKDIGKEEEGLYVLHSQRRNKNKTRSLVMIAHRNEVELWHKRMGHVLIQVLKKIPSIHSSSRAEISPCDICPLARQARTSFPVSNSRAENFGKMIKCFRSDNGSEFFNHNCETLFQMHGIIHQSSCPHTPQQNGVVEKRHRHVLETARAIRFQGNLLVSFWGACVDAVVYIINRIPSTVLGNKSPFELFYGRQPALSHMRIIGCLSFVARLPRGDKFAARSIRSVFLGYASTQMGYRLHDIEHKTLFVSKDVIFHEDVYPFQGLHQDSSLFVDEFQKVDPNPDQPPIVLPFTISDKNDPHFSASLAPAESVPTNINPPLDSHSLPHIEVSATGQHETNVGKLKRSGKTSKPPIWLKDYVGPIQKPNSSHAAHCQYPIKTE